MTIAHIQHIRSQCQFNIKEYVLIPPKAVIGKKLKANEKIGIEVELEKVRSIQQRVPYWTTTNDGSLKIRGKEFTICVYSNKAKQAIEILKNNLKSKDYSLRTSVHIHLNVYDLTAEEILLLTYYYYIFETSLIRFSGGRFNNFFCVPVNHWWNGHPSHLLQWKKYSSINVFPRLHSNPDTRFSTVEFRSMKGNLNEDYIQNWVDLIVNLKNFVRGKTLEDFFPFLLSANSNSSYYPLVKQIFKNKADILYTPELEIDTETSISKLKHYFLQQNVLEETIHKTLTGFFMGPIYEALKVPNKEPNKTAKKISKPKDTPVFAAPPETIEWLADNLIPYQTALLVPTQQHVIDEAASWGHQILINDATSAIPSQFYETTTTATGNSQT